MPNDKHATQVNELPVVVVTSSFTDVSAAVGCSTGTAIPRCRIVPTFSLANGNVPESPGPGELPALGPCTTVELLIDDERATTFGGTPESGERFSAFNECVCFGGTGGGTEDADRRGESLIEAVLAGLEGLPSVFLSLPTYIELDVPVLLRVCSVCEPPAVPKSLPLLSFNAVLDRALAELGRAQLPTDTTGVCVSAADRPLDDGL